MTLEEQVKDAYKRHYVATKDTAAAHNETLRELVGPFDPDESDEKQALRKEVLHILSENRDELDAEVGDPYALAMRAAIRDLTRVGAIDEAKMQYRRHALDVKKSLGPKRKRGPKEWRPHPLPGLTEEELERKFEKEMEPYDMSLIVEFDDKGGLEHWTIDSSQHYHGHAGPTAWVSLFENLDSDDVRRAISEAFESIDWNAVREELEQEEQENEEEGDDV